MPRPFGRRRRRGAALGRRGRRRAHGRRRHAPRSCRTGPDGPRTGRARSGRGRRGGRTPRDWLAAVTGDSPRTAPAGHSVYLVVLRLLPASGQRCLRSLATTIRQSRGRLRLSRRRLLRRIARASRRIRSRSARTLRKYGVTTGAPSLAFDASAPTRPTRATQLRRFLLPPALPLRGERPAVAVDAGAGPVRTSLG